MLKTLFSLLRSIIFFLGQVIATVLFATAGLLLFWCPFSVRYRVITAWSHFIISWAKLICGIRYQIHGLEHLPKKNAIVLCNHQSAWETLFFQVLLPPQCWVLKRELLWIPFFGWALSLLEPIAINRSHKSNSIKQLLEQGKKRLQQGRWVILFPQGSRIPVGEIGRFSRSGAMLAKESGYLVLPIAHNAGVFWPKQAFLKRSGTIQMVIGQPINPQDFTIDEIQEQTKAWIEQTMQGLPKK